MLGWKLLAKSSELNLKTTFNNGQAFTWQEIGKNHFVNVIDSHLVFLKTFQDSVWFKSDISLLLLQSYFNLNLSSSLLFGQWSLDGNFEKRCKGLEGTRLLKQDPIETIFAFICSQNNNIKRITSLVLKLKSHFGLKIASVHSEDGSEVDIFSFPKVEAMCCDGIETKLRSLGFGYRAKYIANTAKQLNEKGKDWVESLRRCNLPYLQAKDEILSLSGDHCDVVPIDTHVWRIAKRDYKIGGNTLTKDSYAIIGEKFKSIFGEYAGWAHSILFLAEILESKPVANKRKLEFD